MNAIYKYLKDFLSKDIKKVIFNFGYLILVQLTNFILPLLIIPYYLRIIGIENFGIISIAQIIFLFCNVIVEYGFNLTATREVSINRFNYKNLSFIISTVLFLKALLIITVYFFLLLILFFNKNEPYHLTILYGFVWVVGQAIMPIWFFQGIEKMKFITLINLLSKIIFALLIVVFLKQKEHYWLVHFFNGISMIFMGLLSWLYIVRRYKITLKAPTVRNLINELKMGWPIFISNFSITSYNNSNPLILRLFVSDVIVGYYSIAEKIIFALRQIIGVFTQSLYPHLCKLSLISFNSVRKTLITLFSPLLIFLILNGILIITFSSNIIEFFTNNDAERASNILMIMAFVPLVVALNIPPYLILVVYNFKSSMMRVILSGSVLNILLNLILTHYFLAIGTAIAVMSTELFISAGMFLIIETRHKEYSLFKTSNEN